ncbi:unnamed protein product [Symbiodinium sp. CCMP2592]|nr:unnamed protein product [Symbiodinium sp. CCMP2592]
MEDESVGDWDDLLLSYAVDSAAADDHPSLAADDVQPTASVHVNAADADYDSWDAMFLPAVPPPGHAAQMEAAETDRVAVPANRLYGNPSSLQHIGTRLHQSLFSWFRQARSAMQRQLQTQGVDREHEGQEANEAMVPAEAGQTSLEAVVQTYVTEPSFASFRAARRATGVPETSMRRELVQFACALLYSTTWLLGAFFRGWLQVYRGPRFRPLMFVSKVRYDETPLKLKVRDAKSFLHDASASSDQPMSLATYHHPPLGQVSHLTAVGDKANADSYTHAKIFCVEWTLGFLSVDVQSKEHHFVTCEVPTHLYCIDRTTGENQLAVLQDIENKVPELRHFREKHPLQVRLAVADRYSANLVAEREIQRQNPDQTTGLIGCSVHKAASSLKFSTNLEAKTISGVVQTGLALESVGSAQKLRKCLQQIFHEELEIVFDLPPGGQIAAYRKELLDLFVSTRAVGASPRINAQRQFVLNQYCNSDLQSARIIHYCGPGCCSSPEQTFEMFLGFVSWSLIPSKCGLLSRKAWLGADRPVDFIGLLSCVWQLWPRVLSKYTGKPQPGLVNSAKQDDADENSWDSLEAVALFRRPGSADASHDCESGAVEEAAPPDMLNVDADTWAQMNQKNRSAAMSFACSANVAERLVILRQTMEVGLQLLYHMLHVAGPQWEAEQKKKQAETGQRSYRVLDAATGEYLKGFFQQASQMMLSAPRALAKSSYTRRSRATMFRLLASLMACICYFLQRCFEGFPYCLFKLLIDPTAADEILNQRPACMRDSLSDNFLQKYSKPSDPEALCALHALAILLELDISGVESGHSSVREYTMSRGRGHTPDLAQVSAKRLCAWFGRKYVHPSDRKQNAQQKRKQRKEKKHARPGGAWRAFCSDRAKGQKFNRVLLRALSAEYRGLSQDEYEMYRERGVAATAAARLGNKRPFSLVDQPDQPLQLALRPAEVLEKHTDLVLRLPGSDFESQFEVLRARLRAGHRADKSRAAVAPADVPLDTSFLQQALDRGGGPGLVEGVRTRPHAAAVPKLQHHCFVPPAVGFAKDALAFSKSRRSQMEGTQTSSMSDWLHNQWTLEHTSLRHEDRSKIPRSKKHASGMGPCGLTGTCSCSRPKEQEFCKKLAQLLRKTFWKRRGVACAERLDYEAGRLVVSLKIGDGEQEVFFFPGYTNFTTWTFSAVVLRPRGRQDEAGVLKLVFGDEETHVVESPWTVLADLLTMQALVRKFVDVSKPCTLRLWKILEDEQTLAVWQMQPRFVDVCLHADELAFWLESSEFSSASAAANRDQYHGVLDDMGDDAADDEQQDDDDEEDNRSLFGDSDSPAASQNADDEAVEALLGDANAQLGPDADAGSDASQSEHEVHIPDDLFPAEEPVPDAVAALLALPENPNDAADEDAPGPGAPADAAAAAPAAPAAPAVARPIGTESYAGDNGKPLPAKGLYIVFLRKDIYSKDDVLLFKKICQDIGQKQQAHGPLEIFDVLLPECGADYAAEMAKVSAETRGQDGRCAHMCSSYTAKEFGESSVHTYSHYTCADAYTHTHTRTL